MVLYIIFFRENSYKLNIPFSFFTGVKGMQPWSVIIFKSLFLVVSLISIFIRRRTTIQEEEEDHQVELPGKGKGPHFSEGLDDPRNQCSQSRRICTRGTKAHPDSFRILWEALLLEPGGAHGSPDQSICFQKDFKTINKHRIIVSLDILIYMSMISLSNIEDYWFVETKVPKVAEVMYSIRFYQLRGFLNFNDIEQAHTSTYEF